MLYLVKSKVSFSTFNPFLSVLIFSLISKSRALFLIFALMCDNINFLIVFSTRLALKSWPKKICLRLVSTHNSHHEMFVSGFVRKLSVKVSPKSSFVQVCLIVRLIIILRPLKLFLRQNYSIFSYANKQNMLYFAF